MQAPLNSRDLALPPALSWREKLLREAAGATHVNQFSAGLTGIRGLAAMMVLLHHVFALAVPRVLSIHLGHWQVTYHWLLTGGWMGANVFFVLSGFLLAVPFVRHIEGTGPRIRVAPYLLRRVRRVVPAYWAQIVILAVVSALTANAPSWLLLAVHFAFLQNFDAAYAFALNGVYWTLPTEFGYYLLLPLFAVFSLAWAGRERAAWLVLSTALVVFAITYRIVAFRAVADAPIGAKVFALMQLPGLIDHFAIGMLLAWVYVRHGATITARQADTMVVAGLVGIASMMALLDHVFLAYWNGHVLLFVGYTITAFFIGLMVLGTAVGGRVGRSLFANPAILFLGIVSYSLYLWHAPIQYWTQKLLDQLGVTGDRFWYLLAVSFPLSVLAATLSYWWIERPLIGRRAPGGGGVLAAS